MIVGVPKEIKEQEFRVGLTPAGVYALCQAGHTVYVQQGAGEGSGITDDQYILAGAKIIPTAEAIYADAQMIIKVKEPQPTEYYLCRPGQIVFTYFHFAASRALTEAMLDRKIIAVAYETVSENGKLPLLEPMSEIAGRLAVQEGAVCLEKLRGGRGVLLGGVPGVCPAKVVILGGGTVGANAALIAAGMKADVTILDINLERLRYLDMVMPANVRNIFSDNDTIEQRLKEADLVIGAVLKPGAKAPRLITAAMRQKMPHKSVIVDVAIDQGGCVEGVYPTTHKNPTFEIDGVIHYCVANMPAATPRTSTFALTNATLPYALMLANKGVAAALDNPGIASGINMIDGQLISKAVAQSFDLPYAELADVLN